MLHFIILLSKPILKRCAIYKIFIKSTQLKSQIRLGHCPSCERTCSCFLFEFNKLIKLLSSFFIKFDKKIIMSISSVEKNKEKDKQYDRKE